MPVSPVFVKVIVGVALVVIIGQWVVLVVTIVDACRTPARVWQRTGNPRALWLVVMIVGGIPGIIAYWLIPRRQLKALASPPVPREAGSQPPVDVVWSPGPGSYDVGGPPKVATNSKGRRPPVWLGVVLGAVVVGTVGLMLLFGWIASGSAPMPVSQVGMVSGIAALNALIVLFAVGFVRWSRSGLTP